MRRRFVEQASTIIDPERTEVRFNGEWLAKLDFAEILRLTRTTTVAQILERDDFAKRQRAREPISVSELLYPLMQAYDSVAVEADVELGGTDQLYNLLAGREVMEAYGLEPQVALTVEYLVSWDGAGMSASRGNYIGLKEDAGRTVREGDADPGRAASAVVPAGAWSRTTTRSRTIRCRPSSRSRAGSSLARTGRRRLRPPRSTSRGSCERGRRPRTCRRRRCRPATRSISRRSWPSTSGSRRATRAG